MIAAHTPGPWVVKGRVHSSGEAIRIESHHPGEEHHLYQVCDVLDANGYPQNSANLALIAAAPDLLDALQMAKHIVANEGTDAQMKQVFDAIEKATGAPA